MMQAKQAPVEYTVYTFDLPSQRRKGENSWKRHFCSLDRDQALAEAMTLLSSRQFHKIEIKQKFFDPKAGRIVDKTFRTLSKDRLGWTRLFANLWRNSTGSRLLIDR